jgi:hypothetical protein
MKKTIVLNSFKVEKRSKILLFAFIISLVVLGLTSYESSGQAVPKVRLLPGGPPALDAGKLILPDCQNYSVEEFIAKGIATSYKEVSMQTDDGKWLVEANAKDTASYTTRILVLKPKQAAKFNGKVLIEWINVSGGFDYTPARIMMWRELIRSGWVWIGVSAQKVGIEGGKNILSVPDMSDKKSNPQRYGQLHHPGDAYSYNIFTQAARLVKGPNASALLGDLVPKQVIATGHSQSSYYLTTYVNAVEPVEKVFDGYFVYGRLGAAAPITGSDIVTSGWIQSPKPTKIRTDLRVPVMVVLSEADIIGTTLPSFGTLIGYKQARQSDTDMLRVWEIAGTAHADHYLLRTRVTDTGCASYEDLAKAWAPGNSMMGAQPNNAPQLHFVMEAGITALGNWVAKGVKPPKAKPIEFKENELTPEKFPIPVLDKLGNAKGGIRSPWLDVPTSILSGNTPLIGLSGSVKPFDTATLDSLYPGGKAEYMKKFEKALNKQIKAGFILAADREEILGVAKLSYQGSR